MDSVLSDLCFNNLKDDMDEEILESIMRMNDPREVLHKSKELKEAGNKEFKKNNFLRASKLYEQALQYVCVSCPCSESEASMVMDLAISLNLNSAACCLKIRDFCTAITFCDYVLEFDSCNVKAYFRKAMASIELNNLDAARKDLTEAVRLDPFNLEVLDKLQLVEDRMGKTFNRKGKDISTVALGPLNSATRVSVHPHRVSPSFKSGRSLGKSPVIIANEMDIDGVPLNGSNKHSSFSVPGMDNKSADAFSGPDVNMVPNVQNFNLTDMLSAEGRADPSLPQSPAKPILTFTKKGFPDQHLRLDELAYERLSCGKSLEWYNNSGLGYMVVRIHQASREKLSVTPDYIDGNVDRNDAPSSTSPDTIMVEHLEETTPQVGLVSDGGSVDDLMVEASSDEDSKSFQISCENGLLLPSRPSSMLFQRNHRIPVCRATVQQVEAHLSKPRRRGRQLPHTVHGKRKSQYMGSYELQEGLKTRVLSHPSNIDDSFPCSRVSSTVYFPFGMLVRTVGGVAINKAVLAPYNLASL